MICLIWANLRHCFSLLHLKNKSLKHFKEREKEKEKGISKKNSMTGTNHDLVRRMICVGSAFRVLIQNLKNIITHTFQRERERERERERFFDFFLLEKILKSWAVRTSCRHVLPVRSERKRLASSRTRKIFDTSLRLTSLKRCWRMVRIWYVSYPLSIYPKHTPIWNTAKTGRSGEKIFASRNHELFHSHSLRKGCVLSVSHRG